MASTKKLVLGALNVRYNFHYAGLLLITFVIASVYLTGGKRCFRGLLTTRYDFFQHCDLFSGRWVYDNVSYPLYEEKQCSLMDDDFSCEKYGKKDLNYQKWRWQPHDCDLPRFNAIALLKKLRGKKLVFVGDSLNRNQFMSMLCLIESSIPESSSKLSLLWKGNSIIFKATVRQILDSLQIQITPVSSITINEFLAKPMKEYNATIEFYWAPLLVESSCDDMGSHNVQDCIIRIKAIEKHARYWTYVDILVFDSFARWLGSKTTLVWGSFGSSDAIYKEVEMRQRVYEMTLNTWSNWLENHIKRSKTKLFFMSLSPYRNAGEDTGGNYYNETEPGRWGSLTDGGMMQIVESVIHKLKTRGLKVYYLNITQLSDYRKDAHTCVYKKFCANLTEEQLASPVIYSDCGHWCLPGVPDVWNTILHSYIMHS